MFRRSKRPTTHRIEIYLENLDQLFNSMDPSPFHEKDLDEDAEEFIVSWAEEYPVHDPIVLVIHLRRYPTDTDPQQVVERAVHNHFAYKARLNRLQFRRLLREGRISLLIGSLFLGTCLLTTHLLQFAEANALGGVLRESLTIGGWVAMWRPMEIFLYAWWPLLRPGRMYENMSHMQVEVRRRNTA
jgi:hypothetical protein